LNTSPDRTAAWAQDRYREFQEAINWGGLTATFTCKASPAAARAILREAEEQPRDLLVMAARGKDALAAALLGSTTAQVVRATRIPTLVVKPKGAGRNFLDLLFGTWQPRTGPLIATNP
jgi:hypothetical protein